MAIRSDRSIYQLLEQYLRDAEHPLTCVDLMEREDVRQEALDEFGSDVSQATYKVSDMLGFMWRKGLLTRYPHSGAGGQRARYAYMWTDKSEEEPLRPEPPPASFKKTGVNITEREDGVMIEFDKFFVFVRPKS